MADLADPGGGVGIEEVEGLEVVEIEATTLNGKRKVSLSGLALLDDGGGGGRSGEQGQGGGGDGGDEHHFPRVEDGESAKRVWA